MKKLLVATGGFRTRWGAVMAREHFLKYHMYGLDPAVSGDMATLLAHALLAVGCGGSGTKGTERRLACIPYKLSSAAVADKLWTRRHEPSVVSGRQQAQQARHGPRCGPEATDCLSFCCQPQLHRDGAHGRARISADGEGRPGSDAEDGRPRDGMITRSDGHSRSPMTQRAFTTRRTTTAVVTLAHGIKSFGATWYALRRAASVPPLPSSDGSHEAGAALEVGRRRSRGMTTIPACRGACRGSRAVPQELVVSNLVADLRSRSASETDGSEASATEQRRLSVSREG